MNRLERVTGDVLSVISMNTQTNSHLIDAIKNNTFCPQMRANMGKP